MSALYWRPGQNSAITIAGARPNSNVYLLDGTVNTDPSFNTFVISLPPDSIREFQIQTGTYTAELGAGTGQINVVTRSGTFNVKGSLYEYDRNSRFDSPEYTNPDELPPFSQNQFGGTLGGPAGHRVFFFGGYEGLRTTQHMSNITGIHHVTAIAGPAQENLDFYAGVLGMRLVKKSVNQDDPSTYHLFYADAEGHAGSDLTFFPWAHMPRGRAGTARRPPGSSARRLRNGAR